MSLHIRAAKIPAPTTQYRFCERKWRMDFAWPDIKLAVEVHGGTWSGGRHTRGNGFANDREKMNQAVLLGWRVLEFTGEQVKSGYAIKTIEEAMKADPWRKHAERWAWLRKQGGWPDSEAAMMRATPEDFDRLADEGMDYEQSAHNHDNLGPLHGI
jgi:hypothetical protein